MTQRRQGHQGGGDQEPVFQNVRTVMPRVRIAHVPHIPRVVEEVRIDGQWGLTWSNERNLLHLDNDWGVVIFATDDNLIAALSTLQRHFWMELSGRVLDPTMQQIFTIHGKYRVPEEEFYHLQWFY